jgi:hypothetical protein
MAHHPDDFLGTFGEAQRRRSGNQPLSTPHEKFGVKFVSKAVELETYGAGRQVNLFRRAGHAGGVHDREEQFELVDIHLPAPTAPAAYSGGLAPGSAALFSHPREGAPHSTLQPSRLANIRWLEAGCTLALILILDFRDARAASGRPRSPHEVVARSVHVMFYLLMAAGWSGEDHCFGDFEDGATRDVN